jgi:hypothetical protein
MLMQLARYVNDCRKVTYVAAARRPEYMRAWVGSAAAAAACAGSMMVARSKNC